MNSGIMLPIVWLVVLFGGTQPVILSLDSSEDVLLRQGYYDSRILYYVPLAASDMRIAKQFDYFVKNSQCGSALGVDYVPALRCLLDKDVRNDVYLLCHAKEPAVFSTEPGNMDYTPIWDVHLVTWLPGHTVRPLISVQEILDARDAGEVMVVTPGIILDATIVIPTSRIPMSAIKKVDFQKKTIELPALKVLYNNKESLVREVRHLIVPDISDLSVAMRLGVNYAPRLANAPDCCSPIYAFVNHCIPPGQYPIISQAPEPRRRFDDMNLNEVYSPLVCWSLFDRGSLPISTVVNNQPFMDFLVNRGVVGPIPLDPPIVSNSPPVGHRNQLGAVPPQPIP